MDTAASTADSSASIPEEVKWQIAFFALVPLALGAMTQPVGRVFDMPLEYRFWLRSSPILSVGDIFYFLIRIAIDHFLEPTWSWRHFRTELRYRFRDEDWSQEPKEVEKAALGRWILILIGGIPCQTIKLIAMRGIPLTQTLAMMFFLSQVFGEVLNIAAEAVCRQPQVRQPACRPRRQDSDRGSGHRRPLQSLHGIRLPAVLIPDLASGPAAAPPKPPSHKKPLWLQLMTVVCQGSQLSLTSAVLVDLLLLKLRSSLLFNDYPDILFTMMKVLVFLSTILLGSANHAFMNDAFPDNYLIILPITSTFSTVYLWLCWSIRIRLDTGHRYLTTLVSAVAAGAVAVPVMLMLGLVTLGILQMLLDGLGRLSKARLGRSLGIPREDTELGHLLIFLINVIITVIGYAYLFDSKGTVNPAWLGIFG